MNSRSIELPVLDAQQINDYERLEELDLPKELLQAAIKTLETHNCKACVGKTYRLMIAFLFLGGLVLILALFSFVFFSEWSFQLLIAGAALVVMSLFYFYFDSVRQAELFDTTLSKLQARTFSVLVVKPRRGIIKEVKRGDELGKAVEKERVVALEISINDFFLETYIKDKYRVENGGEGDGEDLPEPQVRF